MLQSVATQRGINSKHCLPLCAIGLGKGEQQCGKKMLFSKTILSHSTTPYLGYFLCILVVRFLVRGHLSRLSKVYQTTKANFISRGKLPVFKLSPIFFKLPPVLSLAELFFSAAVKGWTKSPAYNYGNILLSPLMLKRRKEDMFSCNTKTKRIRPLAFYCTASLCLKHKNLNKGRFFCNNDYNKIIIILYDAKHWPNKPFNTYDRYYYDRCCTWSPTLFRLKNIINNYICYVILY